MKKASGLEDNRDGGRGTTSMARGRWREILGWQVAQQPKHTHPCEREKSQLQNATTGLRKPQID